MKLLSRMRSLMMSWVAPSRGRGLKLVEPVALAGKLLSPLHGGVD